MGSIERGLTIVRQCSVENSAEEDKSGENLQSFSYSLFSLIALRMWMRSESRER